MQADLTKEEKYALLYLQEKLNRLKAERNAVEFERDLYIQKLTTRFTSSNQKLTGIDVGSGTVTLEELDNG